MANGPVAANVPGGALAVGSRAKANGRLTVALGIGAEANSDAAVAIGGSAAANATHSVALGVGSIADRANTVSVGRSDAQRQITNVKAGTAGTDAVNVQQLNAAVKAAAGTGSRYVKVNDGTGAIAGDAVATGTGSIAVGPASNAGGDFATAIGQKAGADEGSAAIGYQATASGTRSVAMGFGAHTNSNANSVALGSFASGEGTGAVAVGTAARAAQDGIATGHAAVSAATDGIAVGRNATAGGTAANGATVGSGSIAIGADSYATYLGTVAIGRGATAGQKSAVALGMDSVADRSSTVSVGRSEEKDANGTVTRSAINRQIANVADGTADTDATTVSQLKGVASAIGGGAGVNADGTIKAPTFDLANGGKQTTVGGALSALDTATTQLNTKMSDATKYIKIKAKNADGEAVATGARDIAIGGGAIADAGSAPGMNSDNYSMAVGASAVAKGGGSVALGGGATVGSDETKAQAINGTALGAGTRVTATNAVALGADSVADRANTVSVGAGGRQRQIANVKAGTAGKDATNVDQLTASVNALGGGAKLDAATGAVTGPTYDLANGGKQTTVGGALSALDTATTKNAGDIANVKGDVTNITTNIANGTVGLVQQDPTSKAITVAKDKDGTSVSITGTAGDRTLAGVKAGTANTDAVNVGQLNDAVKAAAGTGSRYVKVNDGTGAIAGDAVATGTGSIAVGPASRASASYATAIGQNAGADEGSAAIGYQASASGARSVAMGFGAHTNANANSVALGSNSSADGAEALALGAAAHAAQAGIAAGSTAVAVATDSIAVGRNARAGAANGGGTIGGGSIAIGADSSTWYQGNVAIGQGASTKQTSTVALGMDSIADRTNTVSVGRAEVRDDKGEVTTSAIKRQVVNVAAGTQATDATNVEQLTASVNALGGGAKLDTTTGAVTGPTYDLANGGKQTTVGGALSALDTATTKNAGDIANVKGDVTNITTNIANGTVGLVQQDPTSKAITVAKDKDGTSVSLTGTAGDRTLTGLGAGLADNSAVNLAQLKSAGFDFDAKGNVTNSAVTYTAGTIASGSPQIVLNPGVGDSKYYVDGDRSKGKLPKGTIISNVADGKQNTDAANVGQVFDIVNSAVAGGGANGAPNIDLRAMPRPASMAASTPAQAGSGVDTTGLTNAYKTAGYYSQATGLGNSVGSTPPSDMAHAVGQGSIAYGSNAYAGADKSVAVGVQAYTSAADSVALGAGSVASQANTVSVGSDGTGSYTAIDANGKPYTIQNAANTRRVVNMAAGQSDTDAVNVSQLKGIANVIGGGAGVNADGTIKAPTFDLANGGKQTTVGGALSALDTATTKNAGDIASVKGDVTNVTNNITNGTVGLVQQDPTSKAITVAKDKDGTSVSITGTAGARTLTGVKAGALTATSTDAVNGSQLFATNQNVAKNTSDIGGLSTQVTNISNSVTNATRFVNAHGASTDKAAVATGTRDIAIGANAVADSMHASGNSPQNYSVAIGNGATANGGGAVAFGGGAVVGSGATVGDQINGTAVGAGTSVTQANAVALGYGSVANRANTVSVGASGTERQIANVKAGTADTDATTVSQLKGIAGAIGGGAGVNADGTIKAPTFDLANGGKQTTVGGALSALDTATSKNTADISKNTGDIGNLTNTVNNINANIGDLGNMVSYDSAAHDKLTLGGLKDDGKGGKVPATAAVTVSNVAAGKAGKDATNVDQLTGAVNALGGGAKLDTTTGAVTGPTYDLANGGKQTTVGGALSALDTATTKNAGDIANVKGDVTNITTNIANGTVGLVQQDPTSKAITVAKDKDGTSVSLTGTAGDRTLTGLGAGLADNSAVNLAQLKSAGFDFDAKGNVTNSAVTYTAGTIASGSPHIVLSAGQGDSPYFVDGDRSKGKLPKGTIISNVATGKQDTDAANVGQVYDIMNQVDQTDQSSDDANAIQTRAMPGPTSVSKPSWWPSNGSIGQGINLRASTDSSGVDVTGLTKSYKTAAYYAQASGLGDSVGSTGPSDMARAEGKGSLAFGSNAYASTDKSAAIGVHAYTSAADSVALGAGSVANQANTVSVGSDGTGSYTAVDANGQTYTIQNGANTRRVVNMAAGHDDTDAVNVSQLKGVTSALGGGAAVNVDGTIKAPTFSVQGGTQTTVADALGSLDTATTKNTGDISNVTNTVNNITNGAAGLVQQDPTSKQITVAKDKDGTSVSFAGTTGERTLTGLSDGVLSATSTDAVTGSQLYATNEAVKKNTGDIGSLSQKVNNINTNIGNVGNMVTYDNAQHDSLTLGGLKDDGKGGQVPVTKPVKVSNVAAGTAASDASTVGQLSPLVDALGGGAKIDSTTGAVTGPTYTVQGTTQTTVGGAVTALDSATTKNASDIVNVTNDMKTIADNITNGKTGLVQQDDVTKSITVAKSLDGDNVDFTGTGGTRELTGVSAGKTDSSAATVGQLRPVVNTLGGGAAINADGSIVAPTYTIQGKAEHNVGDAFKSVDDNLASLKTQIGSGGIGIVTQDATTGIINVGGTLGGDRVNIAGTGGDRVLAGVAPGAVNAKSNEAVNGSQAYNNASSVASALGGGSTVNPDGTITAPSFNVGGTTVHSVGDAVDNIDGRVTQNTNAISGMQSKIDNVTGQVANAVQYDSSAHDKVTLGDSTKGDGVKVSNVADGQLSETSRDAVNGSQLFATNSRLNSLNDAMKAATTSGSPGVSINTDKGPAKATGAASVAIGGGSLATGSNATAIGDGASATGAGAVALGQGSVADQANTVSVGSQGNERRITNVAPGQAPTDAVNMSQFNQGLGDVARSAYSGIAAATALTMIPDVDPGKTIAVGIGTANFKGYQAGAIGASARITQNLKVKVGAGLSAAGTTVGGGMSYQW